MSPRPGGGPGSCSTLYLMVPAESGNHAITRGRWADIPVPRARCNAGRGSGRCNDSREFGVARYPVESKHVRATIFLENHSRIPRSSAGLRESSGAAAVTMNEVSF